MAAVSLITLFLLASVSITNVHSSDAKGKPPTLQNLLDMKCDNPKRPIFCRPYGSCCRYDEYCSTVSSTCDSCFPQHLQNNPDSLLQWCKELGQFNASLMNNPICTVACQARFSSSQLLIDNNTEPSSSVSKDGGKQTLMTVIIILSIITCILIVVIICLSCRLYCIRRSKRRPVHNRVEQEDLGNETKDEEGMTPPELGLKERTDSPTSVAKTIDETKSETVPVHSTQDETKPLLDNGLVDSVTSSDSIDDGAQAASSETTSISSEPQSPQENNTPHKTIDTNLIFSPQSTGESTDREHAPVVTAKTSYQYQKE